MSVEKTPESLASAMTATRANLIRTMTTATDPAFRAGAAFALGGLNPQDDTSAVEALREAAAHDPSEHVRKEASEALTGV